MRLLYITQSFDRGDASGTFSYSLVKKIIENGIDVDVLTFRQFRSGIIASPLHKKIGLYTVPVFWKQGLFKFEFPLLGLLKLMEVVNKNKYDMIHSQELFPGFLGHLAKLRTKQPHILVKEMASNYPTPHGKIVHFFEKNFITKLRYDIFVSWSKYMVENFFIGWGVPKEKIEIIPGGIELDKIPKKINMNKIKERYGIKDENVIVITKPLYRTNAYGILYIIFAMKHIIKEIPNTKLLIAGSGIAKPFLQNLVKEIKISKNVKFLGRVPHRNALILQQMADILPHSFIYAPTTSITILESMASGTPIVCTNSGEAKYLLKDCGILVKPKNPKDIADGIKKVLINKSLGNKLAKKAFRKVKTNFTIKKVADKYIDLYKSFY